MQSEDRAGYLYKKGLRDFHRGRFANAERSFSRGRALFAKSGNWEGFFDSTSYLIRLDVERDLSFADENGRVQLLACLKNQNMTDLARSKGLFALALYELALGLVDQAQERMNAALDLAEKSNNMQACVMPMYALAFCAESRGECELALQHLNKLSSFLELCNCPEYVTKSYLLKSNLFRRMGDCEQASRAAWQAYRTLLQDPNYVNYVTTLDSLARSYLGKGDKLAARHYVELAEQALAGSELRRALRFIESTRYDIEYRDAAEAAEAAGTSPEAVEEARRLVREAGHQGASAAGSDGKLDFCFEVNRGLLTSPNGQQLDLGGQFVLQDLLALFAKYPDRSFSKEEIVRAVWDEDYDPTVHNNKLYVTIRRLRRMLQQMDLAVPSSSLIVRSKDGYRLDPEVHVQML